MQRAEIGEGKPPIGTDDICHERAFCGKVGEPLVVIRMQPLGCHQSDSLPRAVVLRMLRCLIPPNMLRRNNHSICY